MGPTLKCWSTSGSTCSKSVQLKVVVGLGAPKTRKPVGSERAQRNLTKGWSYGPSSKHKVLTKAFLVCSC